MTTLILAGTYLGPTALFLLWAWADQRLAQHRARRLARRRAEAARQDRLRLIAGMGSLDGGAS